MKNNLEKFNKLPDELKLQISKPEIMKAISALEEKYNVQLAGVIIRVMVKDLTLVDLAKFLAFEHDLHPMKSQELVEELKENVFYVVSGYLGITTKKEHIDQMGMSDTEKKAGNVQTSNFFFSSEDEEEVSQLTQNFGPKDKVKEVSDEKINSMVDEVVFETGVSFSSGELSERFVKVLKTYARGVRNRIDTRITLSKDVDKGGLGMSEGRVEEVLKSLDKHNNKKENSLKEIKLKDDSLTPGNDKKIIAKKNDIENFRKKIGEISGGPQRDGEYDLSSMPTKPQVVKKKIEANKLNLGSKDISVPASKDISVPASKDISVPASKDKIKSNKTTVVPVKLETKTLDDSISGKDGKFKSRINSFDAGRKKVEDVKVVKKLSGPVDELRNMNIVDFRRLDSDPMRAAAKIKEKINLLEEDGFGKKLEGIAAWRKSKINGEYIDIGRKSIGQKKPINDIIGDKNMSGHDTLREDEFEAILKLNREIRF